MLDQYIPVLLQILVAVGFAAGCLIASHGPAHAALCERTTEAMASIDPGFAV